MKSSVTRIGSVLKITGILIICSVLLPAFRFGPIGFKPDLPLLFLSILLLIDERVVARFAIVVWFKIFALILLVFMLISGNYGNIAVGELNKLFIIPTEYMQVFSRVFVFYLFIYIGYRNVIPPPLFNKTVSFVFITALIWGIMQVLDISFVKSISLQAYALTETQKNVFDKTTIRIFGTAGNVITWGGLSSLAFFYFFYVNGNNRIKYIGCILAIVNLFYSSSRSALFAFLISIILVELLSPFFIKSKKIIPNLFKKITVLTILCFLMLGVLVWRMPDRLALILMRVENTEEDLTERGRGAQLNSFIDLFGDNSEYYIFGIGKATLDSLGYMEMEPFFLLFAYGIIGVALHYGLLAILLFKSARLRKYHQNGFLFIVGATLFYVIFSFGFFFFREAYSGMPFWWLCGYLIGVMYRLKHNSLQINGS